MVVYRVMLLLFKRLLGREVYLGDVFYIYLRLFERVVKLFKELGGGLLIVFFIIEI